LLTLSLSLTKPDERVLPPTTCPELTETQSHPLDLGETDTRTPVPSPAPTFTTTTTFGSTTSTRLQFAAESEGERNEWVDFFFKISEHMVEEVDR
jgi:hypothetical protein